MPSDPRSQRPQPSVAVLSDIHGVLPALDAALSEPDVRAAALIVVTGDLASGPQPVAVLDRLAALGERAVLIGGNADRELVALHDDPNGPTPDEISPWAARQLAPRHVDLLRGLPPSVTLTLAGFGPTLFCHATPRDDEEVVLVDSRVARWAQVFAGLDSDVTTIVCGHTHMPFVRLVDRRLVINPGSIGMPYGRAGAHWALLADGGVSLRRSRFDTAAAAASILADCDFPNAAEWLDDHLNARAGDLDAIAAFGPRDGRDMGGS